MKYVSPGHNKMRMFQEEIFGPVLAVTTFRDEAEAIEIATYSQTKNLLVSYSTKPLGLF